MMSDEQKTCVNCAHGLHNKEQTICLRVFDFVTSFSPVCRDYVQSFQPIKYTGECVSRIKEKSYSSID